MPSQISNKEEENRSKAFDSTVFTRPQILVKPFVSDAKLNQKLNYSKFEFKLDESAIFNPINRSTVYRHKTAFDRKAEEMKTFLVRNPVPEKFLKKVARPDF